MSESLIYDCQRDILRERLRSMAVTQGMKTDAGKPALPGQQADRVRH